MSCDVLTYFTEPDGQTKLVYSSDGWTKVTLALETPGPVAFGTKSDLGAVASGGGRLLPTNRDIELVMSPGTRLYFASDTIDRIAVQLQEIPFLAEILMAIQSSSTMPAPPPGPASPVKIGHFGFTMPAPKPVPPKGKK